MTIPANIARPSTRNNEWTQRMITLLDQRADALVNTVEPTNEENARIWANAVLLLSELLNHVYLAQQLHRPSTVTASAWADLTAAYERATGVYSDQLYAADRVPQRNADGTLAAPQRRTAQDVMDFSTPGEAQPPADVSKQRGASTGGKGASPGAPPAASSAMVTWVAIGGAVVVGAGLLWFFTRDGR